MITVSIPGRGDLKIEHVFFDFNGTLATDGKLMEKTRNLLRQLKKVVEIHVLTSDTYGTARAQCSDLEIEIEVLTNGLAAPQKAAFIEKSGAQHACCIGNGMNDVEMFHAGALSIIVIGDEGGAVKALQEADIVVKNIEDAISILLEPQRIVATLRG